MAGPINERRELLATVRGGQGAAKDRSCVPGLERAAQASRTQARASSARVSSK